MRFSQFLVRVGLLCAVFCGLTPAVSQAATFTVNKLDDTLDGACNADCSLREAMYAATAQVPGPNIIRFSPTVFDRPRTIKLIANGFVVRGTNLTIDGPDKAPLTIECDGRSRLFTNYGGTLAIDDLIMANGNANIDINLDNGDGGCIYSRTGSVTLNRCVITRNKAAFGGGIYSTQSTLQMTNCTMAFNSSISDGATVRGPNPNGGALVVGDENTTAVLQHCTIAGNRIVLRNGQPNGTGGIINYQGTLQMSNTIVANNFAITEKGETASRPDITGIVASRGWNLVRTPGKLSAGGSTGYSNSDLVGVDPLLQSNNQDPALKDNGGGTLTIALLAGSPASNKGRSDLTEDARGAWRPSGGSADIGAYERQIDTFTQIQSIVLDPAKPTTDAPITAIVNAILPDAPAAVTSYQWTRIRGGKSKILSEKGIQLQTAGSIVEAGDRIEFRVTMTTPSGAAVSNMAAVTIVNSPIQITGFDFKPRNPYSFETMVATVKTTDPDRTKPTFTFTWKKNGAVTRSVSGSSNQDLYNLKTVGMGDKGDVIEVSVVASDGPSSASAQRTASIRNSVPVIESVSLSPQAPTPTSTVVSTYSGRDADGDKLTKVYKWRIGTKLLKDETGSRLDLRKYTFVKAGDVVSVDLQLSDGESLSKTLTTKVTVAAPATSALAAPMVSPSEASS